MNVLRDIRLIPVVLVAAASLVTLKVSGLVLDGGYVLRQTPSGTLQFEQRPTQSWAQEMLGYPGGKPRDDGDGDITGSVAAKPAPKPEAKPEEPPKQQVGTVVVPDQSAQISASERAVLERLQERRLELDRRAREIDIRESLLKAAEGRIENRIQEVKATEARVTQANEAKIEADKDRFKGLVTMYEAMKPKDAAKIFDRLDMSVLYAVASQMKPQKLSEVLAVMQADNAQRLTVELARPPGERVQVNADLPKIEGRPAAQ